jgi:hypothetical protein
MRDRGGNEPLVEDEDWEAAADLALGLIPEDAETKKRETYMKRLDRVGIKLTAKHFLSDRRKRIFIRTLAETGIVSRAAAAAGWNANTAYQLRKANKDFETMWNNAMEFATDSLELEARRRGQFGVQKPVYQQGRLVGYQQEYSDPLLILLLKAHRADKFRDQQKVEHEHKGGVLVVPGLQSEGDWEAAAGANQASHRANQGEEHADEQDPIA